MPGDGSALVGGAFDGSVSFGDATLVSAYGWDTFLAKCVERAEGCSE